MALSTPRTTLRSARSLPRSTRSSSIRSASCAASFAATCRSRACWPSRCSWRAGSGWRCCSTIGVFKVFSFDWRSTPEGIAHRRPCPGRRRSGGAGRHSSHHSPHARFQQLGPRARARKALPKLLGDRLITAVQLSDLKWASKYGYSTQMIKKTIDDVRDKIDQVPVHKVFNWKRLWLQAGIVPRADVRLVRRRRHRRQLDHKDAARQRSSRIRDVSTILAERDILLRNTPWPRRAYLDWSTSRRRRPSRRPRRPVAEDPRGRLQVGGRRQRTPASAGGR